MATPILVFMHYGSKQEVWEFSCKAHTTEMKMKAVELGLVENVKEANLKVCTVNDSNQPGMFEQLIAFLKPF